MIYLVLGMHKSGTTLVSQILHNSGINMGDFDQEISYDRGNTLERFEFLIYNTAIMNIRILDAGVKQYRRVTTLEGFTLPRLIRNVLTRAVERLDRKFPEWGCKDPRMCLTYQVWREILPLHRIISVVRDPFEVADRYCKYVNRFRILKRLVTRLRVISSWYLHNSAILEIVRDNGPDCTVVDYNRLMSEEGDKEFRKMEKLCGRKLTDTRDRSLYRNRKGDHTSLLDRIIEICFKYVLNRDLCGLREKLLDSSSRISGDGDTSTGTANEPGGKEEKHGGVKLPEHTTVE